MLQARIHESVSHIRQSAPVRPQVGIILGSGLGDFIDLIENPSVIPYGEIPNFPVSTAPGHKGRLVIGRIGEQAVCCMQGRLHLYEGHSMQDITYPVRVMRALGIETLVITNAAGGLDSSFCPGDLMLIENHINYMGDNPLKGPNNEALGPRFVDMTHPYDPALNAVAREAAEALGMRLQSGVYVGVTGPSFETASEIRFFRMIGGSAVGMSTVPEVIVANHAGMKVLAISCITNMGTGITSQPQTVEEVFETAERAGADFRKLLAAVIEKI